MLRELTRYPLSSSGTYLAQGTVLAIAYAALWSMAHIPQGLNHDGQLYAFQALAKIKPDLVANDLFLGAGSQDQYTLFTPLYAWLISQFDLGTALVSITVCAHVMLAIASWWVVRALVSREAAHLAVGLMIVTHAYYGGLEIFKVAEEYLSARLPAEALSMTSLALWLNKRRISAVAAVAFAMTIHPLVAFPCAIAIFVMWWGPQRLGKPGLAAACTTLLAIGIAILQPMGPLSIIDADWLAVIEQRSEHLFVQYWSASDWQRTTMAFATLLLAWSINRDDEPISGTLQAVLIVGLAGLALATISSLIPVSIILMGQPWRWLWLPTVCSVLLVGPTVWQLVKRTDLGLPIASLLLAGWILPSTWGGVIGSLTLLIWLNRDVARTYLAYLKFLCFGALAIAALVNLLSVIQGFQLEFISGAEPAWIERGRMIMAAPMVAATVIALVWYVTLHRWRRLSSFAVGFGATALFGFLLPNTSTAFGAGPLRLEHARPDFAEWREAIPPNKNVFWHQHNSVVWLLLERPSYLSLSSSAGVVFSRATAMEVARRADILDPLIDRSVMRGSYEQDHGYRDDPVRELTASILQQICRDPALGFVVSDVDLGFGIRNTSRNPDWRNLRLYDCERTRRENANSLSELR